MSKRVRESKRLQKREQMRIKPNEYVEEQGPVLEPDIYSAILTGFGEHEGQYGPRLVWQFEVEDGSEAVEAAGFTSYSMADGKKQSNLIKWTKALIGEIPEEGLDLEHLLGKPCRVDIVNYTKQNGITKNKVNDVRPPKKGQKGRRIEKPEQKASAGGGKDVKVSEEDFEDIPFAHFSSKRLIAEDIL
jgi:hypothetical protein